MSLAFPERKPQGWFLLVIPSFLAEHQQVLGCATVHRSLRKTEKKKKKNVARKPPAPIRMEIHGLEVRLTCVP